MTAAAYEAWRRQLVAEQQREEVNRLVQGSIRQYRNTNYHGSQKSEMEHLECVSKALLSSTCRVERVHLDLALLANGGAAADMLVEFVKTSPRLRAVHLVLCHDEFISLTAKAAQMAKATAAIQSLWMRFLQAALENPHVEELCLEHVGGQCSNHHHICYPPHLIRVLCDLLGGARSQLRSLSLMGGRIGTEASMNCLARAVAMTRSLQSLHLHQPPALFCTMLWEHLSSSRTVSNHLKRLSIDSPPAQGWTNGLAKYWTCLDELELNRVELNKQVMADMMEGLRQSQISQVTLKSCHVVDVEAQRGLERVLSTTKSIKRLVVDDCHCYGYTDEDSNFWISDLLEFNRSVKDLSLQSLRGRTIGKALQNILQPHSCLQSLSIGLRSRAVAMLYLPSVAEQLMNNNTLQSLNIQGGQMNRRVMLEFAKALQQRTEQNTKAPLLSLTFGGSGLLRQGGVLDILVTTPGVCQALTWQNNVRVPTMLYCLRAWKNNATLKRISLASCQRMTTPVCITLIKDIVPQLSRNSRHLDLSFAAYDNDDDNNGRPLWQVLEVLLQAFEQNTHLEYLRIDHGLGELVLKDGKEYMTEWDARLGFVALRNQLYQLLREPHDQHATGGGKVLTSVPNAVAAMQVGIQARRMDKLPEDPRVEAWMKRMETLHELSLVFTFLQECPHLIG